MIPLQFLFLIWCQIINIEDINLVLTDEVQMFSQFNAEFVSFVTWLVWLVHFSAFWLQIYRIFSNMLKFVTNKFKNSVVPDLHNSFSCSRLLGFDLWNEVRWNVINPHWYEWIAVAILNIETKNILSSLKSSNLLLKNKIFCSPCGLYRPSESRLNSLCQGWWSDVFMTTVPDTVQSLKHVPAQSQEELRV